MNTNTHTRYGAWRNLAFLALAACPLSGGAAPGTLSDEPLFATTSAEPNIFFMIDDSGSMDMDLLTPEAALSGIGGSTGLMSVNVSGGGYYGWFYATYASDNAYTTIGSNGHVVPTQESVNATYMPGVWRARNSDYNKQYYDPDITYEPWAGVDSAGNTYTDASATAARINPYNAGSATVNLTVSQTVSTRRPNYTSSGSTSMSFSYIPARYWVWVDSDSDDIVDATDTHTLIEIESGTTVCANGTSATSAQQAAGSGCMLRSYSDEIQNFANWWTYHRRREYAMKYAVSHVVSPANGVRMGMATINASDSSERYEMASMNADAGTGNKKALLDTLFAMQSLDGTPLNDALRDSGAYFECSGTNLFGNTNCPLETGVVAPATEAAAVCQQNFTVFMTDGYYTDSISGFDNADNDASSWADGGITYQFDGNPYADTYSNTLADIAMDYYERDLHGSVANQVPIQCGVDENPGQHMVTYTVAFGVSGALDPDTDIPAHPNRGYASGCTATTAAAVTWTDPATDDGKIDELLHAAYNARGEYYSAGDPSTLSTSLSSTLKSISDRTGSAAAVAFNSATLGTGSAVYLALFNSTNWSGDLLAYALNSSTGVINTTATWSASSVLDARDLGSAPRVVLTHGGSDGVAFQWANLTTAQKNDLKTNPTGSSLAVNDAVGKARLNFLRGDRSCEIGASGACSVTEGSDTFTTKAFRARSSRLGDLVYSGPVHVGTPELNWPDKAPFPATTGTKYSDFKSSTSRTGVIYIGANDGMLHGFQASDGAEVLAYIPANLYSTGSSEGLHYLTDPAYTHQYYVDLRPSISDAYVKTSPTGSPSWRTVLIGGERAGGRGLFALDVTDPSNFSEANAADLVLWEFGSGDDADLGYTFSRPTIALLNNNQWAAVFGNGYNDTGSGEAKLFIVFLEGGLDGTWTAGTDYLEITTGVGDTSDRNGLGTPALVDTDDNGTADRVYAGDLQGNVWAFDLCNKSGGACQATGWDVAYKTSSTPKPLFTAAGNQPITTMPVLVGHPTVPDSSSPSNAPNLMVLFGTGQYLVDADKTSTHTQSFYGVWDDGTQELDRTKLVAQTFETGFAADVRVLTNNSVPYTGSGSSKRYGWYIDLPDTAERVVTDAVVRGEIVYFNTTVPSVNPCSYGGSGWLMSVKYENGGRPDDAIFDIDGNGDVDSLDLVSSALLTNVAAGGKKFNQGLPASPAFLGDKRYTPGTSTTGGGGIDVGDVVPVNTGRLSWQELE